MLAQAKSTDFVTSRVFDAPRDLVWQCFTDPERMKEWWGPKGSIIVASKMDLRIGGAYHGAMRDPHRPRDVGQIRLSRDRRAGAPGLGTLVFRRSRRPDAASAEPELAAGIDHHSLVPSAARQ